MRIYKANYSFHIFILILTSLFVSCSDDLETEVIQENEDFYSFMQDWYYWYSDIPTINPSTYNSPREVLEAIRYRPLDRWSYIADWAELKAYYEESKYIGYGFGSMWDATGRLRVSFIYSETDLYTQGVRRGWIIDAINGNAVRQGVSVSQLLGANQEGVTNAFRFIRPDNSTVDIVSAKQEVMMNTVLHVETMESAGRKIGYLVLQGFTGPTIGELNEAFGLFESAGIDELILDLRYNSGGLTSAANYLSSMIGGDRVFDKVFIKYDYNDKKSAENNKVYNFIDSLDHRLNIDRLITITSRFTASASETVINSLRPFMPVYIVGDNTYGKPMGMNIFGYPSGSPRYAFVPITFKTKNADNEGDYFDGFEADISVGDDLTRGFGDPEESSLQAALQLIEFGAITKELTSPLTWIKQPRDEMSGLRFFIGAH